MLLDEELEGSGIHNLYSFRSFENYFDDITYDDMEHDPPGLFGKRDWWFDGNTSWFAISDELGLNVERVHSQAKGIMDREIVVPSVA